MALCSICRRLGYSLLPGLSTQFYNVVSLDAEQGKRKLHPEQRQMLHRATLQHRPIKTLLLSNNCQPSWLIGRKNKFRKTQQQQELLTYFWAQNLFICWICSDVLVFKESAAVCTNPPTMLYMQVRRRCSRCSWSAGRPCLWRRPVAKPGGNMARIVHRNHRAY